MASPPAPRAIHLQQMRQSVDETQLAILDSEPEIYFYSRCQAATGFIYTYPLMEEHAYALKLQRQMIDEIVPLSWRRVRAGLFNGIKSRTAATSEHPL